MSDELKKIAKLQDIVDDIKSKVSKSEGALERVLDELRKEFKCASIEDAEALIESNRTSLMGMEKQFKRKLKKIQRQWGDVLDDPH